MSATISELVENALRGGISTELSELISAPLKIERIVNGFILTWPSGAKSHAPTFESILSIVTGQLASKYEDAKRHEWDGKLEVWIGFEFSNGFSSKGGIEG